MNPILEMTADPKDPVPLVELKQHLVIFVEDPPGPVSARAVYDLYMGCCSDRVSKYKSTAMGAFVRDWNPAARAIFEQQQLPALRTNTEWGYGFTDGKPRDSWLFMFHGFRPAQEPDKASFYRFEFDWDVDPAFLRGFAERLMSTTPFLSGYAGFFLQGRPNSQYETESYDRIFAFAMRYWGCEAVDVELTASRMKKGYKCVNWLTLIGEPFRSSHAQQIRRARSVAFDSVESQFGVLVQAAQRPVLGDRNRMENMDGYAAVAAALLPVQIKDHAEFFGERWTDQNTVAWLRRFTRAHGIP